MQTLAVMGRSVVVRDDKIRRELGFQNAVSIEEGLAGVSAGATAGAGATDTAKQ